MNRTEPRTYLTLSTARFNLVLGIFLLLTALMLFFSARFNYLTGFLAPQDLRPAHLPVLDSKAKIPFVLFFIVDYLWALGLILLILAITKGYLTLRNNKFYDEIRNLKFSFKGLLDKRFRLLLVIAGTSYLSDFTENTLFLTGGLSGSAGWLEAAGIVQLIKVIAYGILFTIFLFNLFIYFFVTFRQQLFFFLRSGFISLIIILIVTLLLTNMDQGIGLVVDLAGQPVQLFFTYFFLFILAILISHYPIYLQNTEAYQEFYEWRKYSPSRKFPFGWFSILYMDVKKNRDSRQPGPERHRVKFPVLTILRRTLGVALLTGWLYVLIFSLNNYFRYSLSAFNTTAFVSVLLFGLYWYLEKKKLSWKLLFNKRNSGFQRLAYLEWLLPLLFILTISILLATCGLSASMGWSLPTLLSMILTTFLMTVYFIYFRVYRSVFGRLSEDISKSMRQQEVSENLPNKTFRRFFRVSDDNRNYLLSMIIPGYFLFLFLLVLNLSLSFQEKVNPILILLAYLTVYYGIVVTVLKRIRYYAFLKHHPDYQAESHQQGWLTQVFERLRISPLVEKPEGEDPESYLWKNIWVRFVPFILVVLLFLVLLGPRLGENNLHHLTLVPQQEKGIPIADYFENNQKDTVFLMASDGGGVRAAYWNLLIQQKLDEMTGQQFYDQLISCSGASGGSVGQGIYLALKKKYGGRAVPVETIDQIGRTNFLSTDLTFLIGRDFLLSVSPYLPGNPTDRADAMVSNYTRILYGDGSEATLGKSFRDFWLEAYQAGSHLPLLIVNSSQAESGQRAVATPVQSNDNIFSSAIDILEFPDYPNSSLAYFDALFTTNRFPIFSPAARIDKKGHFIDGGYFDNSGLTSTMDILHQLQAQNCREQDSTYTPVRPVLLTIHNDRYWYTWHFLKQLDSLKSAIRTEHRGELSSILGGVSGSSLKGLPHYWDKEIDRLLHSERPCYRVFRHIDIYLPYLLTKSDIEQVLGGAIEEDLEVYVWNKLQIHNDSLIQFMTEKGEGAVRYFELINPPLGRLLPEPVTRYMKACLDFDPVRRELEKVENLISR